jgi:uncharacterized protein (DUF934 family)
MFGAGRSLFFECTKEPYLMALFKNDAFVEDDWRRLAQGATLPLDGKVILSLEQWEESRDQAQSSNIPLGLLVEPATVAKAIAKDLDRFVLVAVDFPKFSDGRGFSLARQIRDDLGFTGELRAIGDILFDQLQYLARCGFDAFEISDGATIRLLESGRRPGLGIFYQPGGRAEIPEKTRPRARRARAREG